MAFPWLAAAIGASTFGSSLSNRDRGSSDVWTRPQRNEMFGWNRERFGQEQGQWGDLNKLLGQQVRAGQQDYEARGRSMGIGNQLWQMLNQQMQTPAVGGDLLNQLLASNMRGANDQINRGMANVGRAVGLESPSGQRAMSNMATRAYSDANQNARMYANQANTQKLMQLLGMAPGVRGFF